MALFSRGKRSDRPDPVEHLVDRADDLPGDTETGVASDAAVVDAASVGISISTFQGVGPVAPPADTIAPAETAAVPIESPAASATPSIRRPVVAPLQTETVPGLRDNVLLREELATLPDDPSPTQIFGVARQMLQSHLFLQVRGDARELTAARKDLPLAIAQVGDKQFVLGFSSGSALQDMVRGIERPDSSAIAQPVQTVIRHVLDGGYAGLILDHASAPARVTLPRELLQRMLDEGDEEHRVKSLLSGTRSDDTAAAIASVLPEVPLWLAVNSAPGSDELGVAESRTPEGERILEVYSHPLEVIAMGREDRPTPITAAQLGAVLRSDSDLAGIILDAAGPWIRLSRAELAPVLALPAPA